MTSTTTESQAEKATTHLSPNHLLAEDGAMSGSSSITEPALEKVKTQPDVDPEYQATAEKTKTNASVISRVVARVSTTPELPQAFRLVAILIALALAMVSSASIDGFFFGARMTDVLPT